ncbi:MAG TPA: PilN domain-containing protein [Gammaproteobacteria bacterium]|nr:PilN domain-containing protein [Gammaproteobacteria bacterium]
MARINLLPWRQWRRRERRRQFVLMLVLALLAGIVIVFWTDRSISAAVATQQARNTYLQRQIARLDHQIETIRNLKKTRDALLARMRIIEQLERSRPTAVHLFDQLVRTVPDGLYLTSVADDGGKLKIAGTAQSPAAVSTYMQRIAGSGWLDPPNLQVVRTHTEGNDKYSDFSVTTSVSASAPSAQVATVAGAGP